MFVSPVFHLLGIVGFLLGLAHVLGVRRRKYRIDVGRFDRFCSIRTVIDTSSALLRYDEVRMECSNCNEWFDSS